MQEEGEGSQLMADDDLAIIEMKMMMLDNPSSISPQQNMRPSAGQDMNHNDYADHRQYCNAPFCHHQSEKYFTNNGTVDPGDVVDRPDTVLATVPRSRSMERTMDLDNENKECQPVSLSYLPQPPQHLLESSSVEYIEPPWQFQQQKIEEENNGNSERPKTRLIPKTKFQERDIKNFSKNTTTRSCLKSSSLPNQQHRHPNSIEITRKFAEQPDKIKWSTPPVQRKYSFEESEEFSYKENHTSRFIKEAKNIDNQKNIDLRVLENISTHESPFPQHSRESGEQKQYRSLNLIKSQRRGKLHVISTAKTNPVKIIDSKIDQESIIESECLPSKNNTYQEENRSIYFHQQQQKQKHNDQYNIVENDQIPNEYNYLSIPEESGYQSIETGTSSVCSTVSSNNTNDCQPTDLPFQQQYSNEQQNNNNSVHWKVGALKRGLNPSILKTMKSPVKTANRVRVNLNDVDQTDISRLDELYDGETNQSSRSTIMKHKRKECN